jgi:NifU-like protein involved in Fe-S cluster formation
MEHHMKTLNKEARETQELFEKLEKERNGNPQSEASFKSQLLYNTAYEILIKCSMEEVEAFPISLSSYKQQKEKRKPALKHLRT